MCGIAGFAGKLSDREGTLKEMTDAIRHRGPDAEGSYLTDEIALGFRRLSIIDLKNGSQPMFNETKTIALIFNGEIYNSPDLREQLQKKGHVFATRSDSEVLIHGYEDYGENVVDLLRGMFAFAIWDKEKKKLFLARDFFGIKPLYYAIIDDHLVFASEIKSILKFPGVRKTVNPEALQQYLSFQYSCLPETFFQGIYNLQPGHFLVYQNRELRICQYFDPTLEPNETMDRETLCQQLRDVLEDSIARHMLADVEIGTFLSSGVDSGYIAANSLGEKTFTVGFLEKESPYNEIQEAKDCADYLGLQNYSHTITEEEYWEKIPQILYYLDEPLADPSAIALYFLAGEASRYVKVVTSGEGADELFGGYRIYHEPLSLKKVTWLPNHFRKAIARLAQKLPKGVKGRSFLIRASKSVEERFIGNANIFSDEERKELLKHPVPAPSPANLLSEKYKRMQKFDDIAKMQYIDLTSWLPGDILAKADKMSMAHSLELRTPFLDREVFEVARQIPADMKIKNKTTKYAFRRAAEIDLPASVAYKRKLGFPVPIRVWLKEDQAYSRVREIFTSPTAEEFFHTDKLLRLLDDHKKGILDNSRKIWTIYIFLVWHQVFFGHAEAS